MSPLTMILRQIIRWMIWAFENLIEKGCTQMKERGNERPKCSLPKCFTPEPDTPYPLCEGKGLSECVSCQLRADWEPDDPYGVGA